MLPCRCDFVGNDLVSDSNTYYIRAAFYFEGFALAGSEVLLQQRFAVEVQYVERSGLVRCVLQIEGLPDNIYFTSLFAHRFNG